MVEMTNSTLTPSEWYFPSVAKLYMLLTIMAQYRALEHVARLSHGRRKLSRSYRIDHHVGA